MYYLHNTKYIFIYITPDIISFTSPQIHTTTLINIPLTQFSLIICRTECKERKDEVEQRFREKVRNKVRYRQADAERNRSRMTSHRPSIIRMSTRAGRSLALSSSSEESVAGEGN
jgi:hypothetical protein